MTEKSTPTSFRLSPATKLELQEIIEVTGWERLTALTIAIHDLYEKKCKKNNEAPE